MAQTISFLWSFLSMAVYAVLLVGFGGMFYATGKKSNLWLAVMLALYMLSEVMEGLSVYAGSYDLTYFNPTFLFTLLIQLAQVFVHIHVIASLGSFVLTRREKAVLLGYFTLMVLFALSLRTRGVYHFLLYGTSLWGTLRLYPLRARDSRSRFLFLAVCSILFFQLANIVSFFLFPPPALADRTLLQRQNTALLLLVSLIEVIWLLLELRWQLLCKKTAAQPTAPAQRSEQIEELIARRGLTPREGEILRMLLNGMSNREIAEQTCIVEGTVKAHIHNIYQKLGVSRRTQLFALFEQPTEHDL